MKRIIITLFFVSFLVYLSIPTAGIDSIKDKLFAEEIKPKPKDTVHKCGFTHIKRDIEKIHRDYAMDEL